MIILGNKNSCEVPVEVIENAVAALSNGEMEEYRLGACNSFEVEEISNKHDNAAHNNQDLEL